MIRSSLFNRDSWDKIAVIEGESFFSYRDLAQRAAALQVQLSDKARENIAIFLPNGADYIAALYGVIGAGMTAMPLNVRLTAYEVTSLLEKASVELVITSEEYLMFFEEIIKIHPVKIICMEGLPKLSETELPAAENVSSGKAMLLIATSGTTGNAKLVQLSERNITSSTLAYIDKMDFEKFEKETIKFILGTPFTSIYGLMVITACVIKAIPIVVLKEAFTLEGLYKAAQEHKVTHFEGGVSVGLLMEQMIGRIIPYDISSFRYFGLAGSKISADTLRKLSKGYPNIEFWTGYGMTEAAPLIAKPYKRVNMDKLDSVGTKIDCLTLMLDIGGRLTDAPHTKGEIVVKGPGIMEGYYKNEKETQKTIKNGYLYTGDIGYIDEEGYLYICGRKKNIIIVRGFNVHIEEVEACIVNSGLVKDCVVYGKEYFPGNETICADIIPMKEEDNREELKSYCKQHLADYKLPREINIVKEIKKTATGKTERT